jgi:hypothetical protein
MRSGVVPALPRQTPVERHAAADASQVRYEGESFRWLRTAMHLANADSHVETVRHLGCASAEAASRNAAMAAAKVNNPFMVASSAGYSNSKSRPIVLD